MAIIFPLLFFMVDLRILVQGLMKPLPLSCFPETGSDLQPEKGRREEGRSLERRLPGAAGRKARHGRAVGQVRSPYRSRSASGAWVLPRLSPFSKPRFLVTP